MTNESAPTKADRRHICHCLRQAFKAAEESGDREAAMAWWSEAIRHGYDPVPKTKMRLMHQIRESEQRNR